MIINSGTGQNYDAGVTLDNQLLTRAITSPQESFMAFKNGVKFLWNSSYSATGADYVIYVANTDPTMHIRINKIILGGVGAQLWTGIKATGGTAAGTVITGMNTNFTSGKIALATSYGNAAVTGGLTGTTFLKYYTLANSSSEIEFDGSIIIPVGSAIAISPSTTGVVAVTISGWYELTGAV